LTDYRVRFVGDLGNLGAFNAAIRGALSSNSSILQQANSGVVSRALGSPVTSGNRTGFQIRDAETELDAYNKSIVYTGRVVNSFVKDYETFTDKFGQTRVHPVFGETYHTDFRKAIANIDQYQTAIARLAPVDKALLDAKRTGLYRAAKVTNATDDVRAFATLKGSVGEGSDQYNAYIQEANKLYKRLETTLGPAALKKAGISSAASLNFATATGQPLQNGVQFFKIDEQAAAAALSKVERQLTVQGRTIKAAMLRQIKDIQQDPVVRGFNAAALFQAGSPEGYIGQNGVSVLQNKAIRNDLVKKVGLGTNPVTQVQAPYGTQDFFANAEQQGFSVDKVYKDLERQVTHIKGRIKDASGIWNEFTYAVDKNGNTVNSWGRRLSGAGGFLNQTVRDFTKVVEWTIATTTVFAALGIAISSLSNINTLNTDLQRFAITARLSNDDLEKMFRGLSQVAYDTATPFDQLIKAADDMALATRRADQSTEEWHTSILELANAVGILTNISGLDTVKATDLLVASMKQLNINTKELVPLLSQITAAAGGQAGSITDIATALGSLAEAASAAGLSTTQQIASIQVISLATNKSADETANAFKNLFGAINADTAVKKLQEFGIKVRDEEGNLRPFLTIYKEISDAINTGVIPQGRISEVLRAISGGRTGRQADAAALIANIGKVFEVEKVAANASNEALIANAAILDTNNAKIIRLQNAFNTAVYEKFNQTIKDLVGTLADLGTVFANVIGAIPQPLISIGTQLIFLVGAVKLLGKAGAALGLQKVFDGITGSIGKTILATEAETLATQGLGAASATPTFQGLTSVGPSLAGSTKNGVPLNGYQYIGRNSLGQFLPATQRGIYKDGQLIARTDEEFARILNPTPAEPSLSKVQQLQNALTSRQSKLAFGAAAVGAGVGLLSSSGQSAAGTASNVSQFAGFGSFLVGGPLGIGLGATLLAASTILGAVAQKEEDAKAKALDLQKSLYGLTEQWKIDQAGVESAKDTYDEINTKLAATTKGTEEYIGLQNQLGVASVDAAFAIQSQHEGLSKMVDILKELNALSKQTGSPDYGAFLGSIGSASGLSGGQVDKLVELLSSQILAASGQPVYSSKIRPFTLGENNQTSGSIINFGAQKYNATDLLGNQQLTAGLGGLLVQSQKSGNAELAKKIFPFNDPEVVAAFRSNLTQFRTQFSPEVFREITDAFEEFVSKFGSDISILQQFVSSAGNQIQSKELLGVLYGDQANNANTRFSIAQQLQKEYENYQAPGLPPDERGKGEITKDSIAALVQSLLRGSDGGVNTTPLQGEDLRKVGTIGLAGIGISNADDAQLGTYLKHLGVTDAAIRTIITDTKAWKQINQETLDELNAKTEEFANGQLQTLGEKLLDFQSRKQGGEFINTKDNPKASKQGDFLSSQYNALGVNIKSITAAVEAANVKIGEEGPAAAKLMENALTSLGVNGLQGMGTSLENLSGAFLNWISVLNLSGENAKKAVTLFIQLMALMSQAQLLLANPFTGAKTQSINTLNKYGEGATYSLSSSGIVSNIQKYVTSIINQIRGLGTTGSGTKNTFSPTAGAAGAAAPTPGTIFFTDEQQKLITDPQAFAKQAYEEALKLQASIPGEAKRNRLDTTVIFDGLQKVFTARGVSEELLRKAMDELTAQVQKQNDFNAKADTIRRIRVGAGDFSAIANVPVNSQTGVSLSGNGGANITLNLNGTVLTPAQFQQFANMVAAAIKRQFGA
jgi:TP901 family phage tail tape measure protein